MLALCLILLPCWHDWLKPTLYAMVWPDLTSWYGTIWSADCFNRVFDCLLEYLTVLLEYIDLEWQGTASIWVGLYPARPALGYTTASMHSITTYYNCKCKKLMFQALKVVEETDDQHYDLRDYPCNANKQYPAGHTFISVPVFSNVTRDIIRKDIING